LAQVIDEVKINTLKSALLSTPDNGEKIGILNELSQQLSESNPQEAAKYSAKALNLSRKLNDLAGEARSQLTLGNAYFNAKRLADANNTLHQALDLNESAYYRYSDAKTLESLCGTYLALTKWYRNHGEANIANEYAKLHEMHWARYQNLYAPIINNLQERIYTSSNESLNPIRNLAPNPSPNGNPMVDLNPIQDLNNALRTDDTLILWDKDQQIKQLKQDRANKETQLNALVQDNLAKDEEIERHKSNKFGWVLGLGVLLLLSSAYFMIQKIYQNQNLNKQKAKISHFGERLNRQEVVLREQLNTLQKKETELANLYGQLDDAKLENNAFTQLLNKDIKPQLALLNLSTLSENTNIHLLHQNLGRLLHLVMTIIDVQNFEKHKLNLVFARHSIQDIAQKSLDQLSELFAQKNILIENNLSDTQVAFFDNQTIEKVFLNIFDNSLKYCQTGDKLSLSSELINEYGRDFVKITIQDTGQVIPAGTLPLVFEKFSPEDARPTGMGMHYIKLAIEQHGGKASVLSSANYGTSFIFTLPTNKLLK
jgi:two-component system, sensor histidine kinase and response regulator